MSERNEGPETAPPLKIRTKQGEVIDLDDVRKDKEMMSGYGLGNPYSVDMAIMVKHVGTLLDALEAALSVQVPVQGTGARGAGLSFEIDTIQPMLAETYQRAIDAVRQAAGVIEERAIVAVWWTCLAHRVEQCGDFLALASDTTPSCPGCGEIACERIRRHCEEPA
jgi:hypothetical protein